MTKMQVSLQSGLFVCLCGGIIFQQPGRRSLSLNQKHCRAGVLINLKANPSDSCGGGGSSEIVCLFCVLEEELAGVEVSLSSIALLLLLLLLLQTKLEARTTCCADAHLQAKAHATLILSGHRNRWRP